MTIRAAQQAVGVDLGYFLGHPSDDEGSEGSTERIWRERN